MGLPLGFHLAVTLCSVATMYLTGDRAAPSQEQNLTSGAKLPCLADGNAHDQLRLGDLSFYGRPSSPISRAKLHLRSKAAMSS